METLVTYVFDTDLCETRAECRSPYETGDEIVFKVTAAKAHWLKQLVFMNTMIPHVEVAEVRIEKREKICTGKLDGSFMLRPELRVCPGDCIVIIVCVRKPIKRVYFIADGPPLGQVPLFCASAEPLL